jgi:hypothetical protein
MVDEFLTLTWRVASFRNDGIHVEGVSGTLVSIRVMVRRACEILSNAFAISKNAVGDMTLICGVGHLIHECE